MPLLEAPNLCAISHSHINVCTVYVLRIRLIIFHGIVSISYILDLISVEQDDSCIITSVQKWSIYVCCDNVHCICE